MAARITNDLGFIEISNGVLAKIAGITAADCYGVVGMASIKKASDSLSDILKRDNLDRGIKITNDGNSVAIDISVVIQYGTSISAVGENIIDADRKSVV